MSIGAFLFGTVLGFLAGILVFRNNRNKIDAAEAKARQAADLLKR